MRELNYFLKAVKSRRSYSIRSGIVSATLNVCIKGFQPRWLLNEIITESSLYLLNCIMTENGDIIEDMVNSNYYDKKEERFLSIIESQQRMIESQQKYSRIATRRKKGNCFPRGRFRLCQCKRVQC